MKKSVIGGIWVVLLVFIVLVSGCARPVATVNGEAITRQQLDLELEKRFGKQVLDELVMETLIRQEVKKRNIVVDPKEIEARLEKIKRDPRVQMMMKSRNISDDELRKRLASITIPFAKIVLQGVGNKEKTALFERFKPDMIQVKAEHILVDTEAEAKKVKSELDSGRKFEDLAREYSKDPGSRDKGGDLGWFQRGVMDLEFSRLAFSLPLGKVGGPVKTRYGFHLIKVTERKDKYEQLKEDVEELIVDQKHAETIQKLRSEAKIKMNI